MRIKLNYITPLLAAGAAAVAIAAAPTAAAASVNNPGRHSRPAPMWAAPSRTTSARRPATLRSTTLFLLYYRRLNTTPTVGATSVVTAAMGADTGNTSPQWHCQAVCRLQGQAMVRTIARPCPVAEGRCRHSQPRPAPVGVDYASIQRRGKSHLRCQTEKLTVTDITKGN
jgi:hypothetical protein